MIRYSVLVFYFLTYFAFAEQLTSYVNPFIGTSNFGATHPGAQYPHAMVSVAPFNVAFEAEGLNKFEKDAAWNSRTYIHDNRFLTGFSHINLSGVGCPDLGSVLVMPTTGKLNLSAKDYGTTYSNQLAEPGYYSTTLDKYQIKAEVTSTLRTGLSRFTFPRGESHILLNLGLGLTNETGSMVRVVSSQEVEGFKTIGTFCYNPEDVRPVYFVARFSKRAKSYGTWKKMPKFHGVEADWVGYNNSYKPYPNYQYPMAGEDIGTYFSFETTENEQIEVKLGISYVSIENARKNLAKEQPKFAFEKVQTDAKNKWQQLLERIQVKGSDTNKTLFYSALYHSLIHPNIIHDVNGDYPKMGQFAVGNHPTDNRYTVFSLWDTNRNLHPLLSLVYPELQSEMVNSMVNMAKESGWLPKWELLGMETEVMVGDPATSVIADTYLRGIRDFDITTAYQYAKKSADTRQDNLLRPENNDYLTLGYVPVDDETTWEGSVSTSLEYYNADWNLAQLAKALGKVDDYHNYHQRALNYKKLFDTETGMLRPKHRNGQWLTPYDPELGRNFEPAPGYIEGNAWNYRFYVPHDIPGLINLLGGDEQFIKQLDKTFDSHNFDMANEPDITYPFLYNYVPGHEWKSQVKVTELIKQHYHNTTGGIPGNDDAGTLSTWLVFSMMGLYPTSPGDMAYAVVTPQFSEVTIHLHPKYYSGKTLQIIKAQNTNNATIIKNIKFNQQQLDSYFINHHTLVKGGELRVTINEQASH